MQRAPVCTAIPPLGVMHVKLALLGADIGLDQMIDHRLRRHALAQQPHAAIAPERVRQRLRRERADAAFAMRTDRADGEELARDGDAEGAACGSRAMMDQVMVACRWKATMRYGKQALSRVSLRMPSRFPRPREDLHACNMQFTTRPDIRGTFGAVATTHWLATQTGMAVLERGGNAFDAAAAAGFVLQIVEPHLNGPGGELPAIVHARRRGRA